MDTTEDESPARSTRRTRSAKSPIVPSSKSPKPAKPTTRRTRKKLVVMEVEVSDPEDEVTNENGAEIVSVSEIGEEKSEEEEKVQDSDELLDALNAAILEDIKEEMNIKPLEPVVLLEDFIKTDIQTDSDKNKIEDIEEMVEETLIKVKEDDSNVMEYFQVEVNESENDLPKMETSSKDIEDKKNDESSKAENNETREDLKMEVDEEESDVLKDEKSDAVKDEKSDAVKDETSEDLKDEKSEELKDEKSEVLKDGESETLKDEKSEALKDEKPEALKDKKSDAQNTSEKKEDESRQNGDPDTENISEDELPGPQVAKVPETEEVSDEELPGPKRAELPADTEVVSEDELPSVKKETGKRKLAEGEYDPSSPTSENEVPSKKIALEKDGEKDDKAKEKPKKLPELDKYWKAVNDDPTDFTGWTYLLQYVDQENDMEAAREAYDAFLSHYPYCYGYWRKYADYEKRKGNKKKCEEVFERGLKAIPLSVDLWIHYLTYVKTAKPDEEEFVRSQFERALKSCGLEFRSDRLWDSYIKWEVEGKRLQKVTAIYDRLLATPTQGYTAHFESFQEHITLNPPNKVVEVDEFLALRKEVRSALKHDAVESAANTDAPPGDEDSSKLVSSDEETKAIRERIISIRRKIHKNTVTAVSARWNFEEAIKRPYFHVKPLERCQLKNWQDYLDYEIQQGDKNRIIVLFERCLIACALYEELWIKFVHYLEGLKEDDTQTKIRDVYERACTIHHLKKPNLHLQWALFEETIENTSRAAEILQNLERSVPNILQVWYRRINLERRRNDYDKCCQLFEHYVSSTKNKMLASNIAIKYARFCHKIQKDFDKAHEILKTAITKDPTNPRLYLQLVDLLLQKSDVSEEEIVSVIDSFLEKENLESEQKLLFLKRKLEYLEDFGKNIQVVQKCSEEYQKVLKETKESGRKKETKIETSKKEKATAQPQPPTGGGYGQYTNYGNTAAAAAAAAQGSYQYSGSQPQGQYNYSQYAQGDQYQYQNWQYPQGSYTGYNQWGSYGSGYGY